MTINGIGRIGVVGAGLMGSSIALNFAVGGYEVALTDTTDENLRKAMENVSVTLGVLREQGLAGKTYVVFASDNGPWLIKKAHGGSARPLRSGKASTWEGAVRVSGTRGGRALGGQGYVELTGYARTMQGVF